MSRAAVSVIMPAYNHGPFVGAAIESVLQQSFGNFEFLIADDGSLDNTDDVIRSYHDGRIRYFPNSVNRGAGIVTNELVRRAQGEFVALINSDDAWVNNKLEEQLNRFAERPELGAVFSTVEWMGKNGENLRPSDVPFGSVFKQPNRTQAQWLRHFYYFGNCLCHPSVLIRRECYESLGLYNGALRQLPDFDMWIRLVKSWPILIEEIPRVRFRVLPGENASSPTQVNVRRSTNELNLIFSSFFDGMSDEVFVEGFGDLFRCSDPCDSVFLEIEKAFLYFAPGLWNPGSYQVIGLHKLYQLLNSPRHAEVLRSRYSFGDRDFHELSAAVDVFAPPSPPSGSARRVLTASARTLNKLRRFIGA